MTITTSKQLAEALGPKWRASKRADSVGLHVATFAGTQALCGPAIGDKVRCIGGGGIVFRKSPRAAVLALADRLEAEARALRESVKEGP